MVLHERGPGLGQPAAPPAAPALPLTDRAPARALPRGTVVLITVASVVVVATGMSAIRGVLTPVLLTLILMICVQPVRTVLRRWRVPEALATVSVVTVLFALLAGFVVVVLIAVAQFVDMLPQYQDQLAAMRSNVHDWLVSIGFSTSQAGDATQALDPHRVTSFVANLLGGAFDLTGALVIVLTMMILMAADAVYMPVILRQWGSGRSRIVLGILTTASDIRRYMVVTTVLGIVQGVLDAIALVLLGVPAAFLWGLLAFLFSFIPNIGYFFAIFPPLFFGYLVGGWPTVIAVTIIYSVINAVVQSIVQPRVVGKAVALSQTITFFSVLFWAVVLGPVGAILAIPLTLLGKSLLVDVDPGLAGLRLVFGPTEDTRMMKRSEDAALKAAARLRRRGVGPPPAPGDDGSPVAPADEPAGDEPHVPTP